MKLLLAQVGLHQNLTFLNWIFKLQCETGSFLPLNTSEYHVEHHLQIVLVHKLITDILSIKSHVADQKNKVCILQDDNIHDRFSFQLQHQRVHSQLM